MQRAISSPDGAVLKCGYTPIERGKANVLIALPFGVPVEIAEPAFASLVQLCNLVSWESRYILETQVEFSGNENLTPLAHVCDMLCILNALGMEQACLIGYCSGAGISLLAATKYPAVFTELILVSGEYQLFRRGHSATAYQRSVDVFLPAVAASRQSARYLFSKIAGLSMLRTGAQEREIPGAISRPFSNEESLFRCAKNYMAYRDFDALSSATNVRQPTFVLSGAQDVHSSPQNSCAISECIAHSNHFVDAAGDHYEFSRCGSRTLDVIREHLQRRHE